MRRLHRIFFDHMPSFVLANDRFNLSGPQTELTCDLGFGPVFDLTRICRPIFQCVVGVILMVFEVMKCRIVSMVKKIW